MTRDGDGRGSVASSTADPREEGQGTSLSRDDVFHLLQSGFRRAVLRHMDGRDDRDGPASLSELATAVVAHHGDMGFEPGHHGGFAASLHHVHLPKLDAAGVLAYDAEEKTARLEERDTLLFDALYVDCRR